MASTTFQEAARELDSFTAGREKQVLGWLAARLPAWVKPDHLTALGLLALASAGLAYAGSMRRPELLLAVNVLLVVNWFGDSLDGTLARYRRRSRPRYGFYLDHLVDMVGALFLLAGLGASGYMSPALAVALLVAYYLMSNNVYLATYTMGRFRISYGGVGGTELRLILMAANLFVMTWPLLSVGGRIVRIFDVIGAGATIALLVTLVVTATQNLRQLHEEERLGAA